MNISHEKFNEIGRGLLSIANNYSAHMNIVNWLDKTYPDLVQITQLNRYYIILQDSWRFQPHVSQLIVPVGVPLYNREMDIRTIIMNIQHGCAQIENQSMDRLRHIVSELLENFL